MPNPDYMDGQNEITWSMRQTLVDWLLQVHLRWHMLPETLWIAINIVDRFLTRRVVSLVKLQLVGVTAMFIAAKYEEILAPSVDEFVFMTENGYSKEEILKGERIVLQTLDFKVSQYCSPYSWMRKISKADDYDIQTRTLGKFLAEITLLDYRFLRCKPSLVAAVAMYSARKMLGGDWVSANHFLHSLMTDHVTCFHFRLPRMERLSIILGSLQNILKPVTSGSARSFLKTTLYSNMPVRSTRTRSSSRHRSSPSSGPRTTRIEARRMTWCSRSNRSSVWALFSFSHDISTSFITSSCA